MHAEFHSDDHDPEEPLIFEDPESSTELFHGDMIGLRGECSVSFVTVEGASALSLCHTHFIYYVCALHQCRAQLENATA